MLKGFLNGIVSFFRGEALREDRRGAIRVKCRYEVYCVDLKEVTEARVTDIGVQGLRLRGRKKFKSGQLVKLVYRGVSGQRLSNIPWENLDRVTDAVRCRVNWSERLKGHTLQTGLVFDDTESQLHFSWVQKILKELGFEDQEVFQRRKPLRAKTFLAAEARVEGANLEGKIINLGAGGALFACRRQLKPGQELRLTFGPHEKLPVLKVRGEVVTQTYDVPSGQCHHGIKFLGLDEEVELLGDYVLALLREQR